MPLSITNVTGDGIIDNQILSNVELPDSGTVVNVSGSVTPLGGSAVSITGSPLTMPAAPGSGSIFWSITVNLTTGAAQVNQSTSATPAVPGGQIQILSQQLDVGMANPAADTHPDVTPDTY